MHFDPYESKQDKKKRIVSDLLILLVIVMFLWGLYHVFFQTRNQLRLFEFPSCTAAEDASGDNAAFAALCEDAAKLKDATLDGDFRQKYPVPAAMLNMEAPFDPEVPYFRIDGDRFVLAQTVLSEQADERILEIMTSKVQTEFADGSGRLTFSDFKTVSLAYHARTGVLRTLPYSDQTFHLNLFSLSPLLKGSDVLCTGYTAVLTGEDLDPAKAGQLIYDPVRATYGDVATKKDPDRLTLSVTPVGQKNQETFNISTAGGTFLRYESITFTFEYQGEAPAFSLLANRG